MVLRKNWLTLVPIGTTDRTLCLLRMFGQVPLYSPNRIVSQSAMLKERSLKGRRRVKHQNFRPLDDRWVRLSTSSSFNYFRAARRVEFSFAFDPP